MTDKTKPHPDHGHPDPDKHGREQYKRHVEGSIAVRGELEIDVKPSLVQAHKTERREDAAHNKKVFIVSIVTLVFVIIYALLTAWQAYSAHRSLDAIKEQFQFDQRPYIALLDLGIVDVNGNPTKFTIGEPIFVNIPYKNVGKSPAFNMVIHRHLLFGSQATKFKIEPPDSDDTFAMGRVLEPTSGEHVTAISVEDTFANESLNIIGVKNWDGSKPIDVFGRISYKDSFGTLYCTPYFYQYLPSGAWEKISFSTLSDTGTIAPADLCPTGKH
jgi:hypothetical protein